MNVQEKINKMENCRGKNHDLLEFRQWLTDAMPNHTALKKIQVAGTNGKGKYFNLAKRFVDEKRI